MLNSTSPSYAPEVIQKRQSLTHTLLDELNAIRDRFAHHNERLEAIADRVFGGVPSPASAGQDRVSEPSIQAQLGRVVEEINGQLSRYETALDRLSEL